MNTTGGADAPLAPHAATGGQGSAAIDELADDRLLDRLPVGVCACDASGAIIRANRRAEELWGRAIRPGDPVERFSGALRLHRPDGGPLSREESPMALALARGAVVRDAEVVVERPDGSRLSVHADVDVVRDASGVVVGAVGCFREVPGRRAGGADLAAQRLAAIVESSDDAILAKDLDGIITNWNRGAERLFGYTAEEAIGRPVTMLIPVERHDEETEILSRIRRGERIEHYETVRRRKDGGLVEISLTISPIKNEDGVVVGASKIARDVTERHRAEQQQTLLLREMDHRIKNLFALAGSIVSLSARAARTPQELATTARARLAALARANALTLPVTGDPGRSDRATTLHALIETILSPYGSEAGDDEKRVTVGGADVPISGASVTAFALLLHEFATNAAKYGALSTPEGRVHIECAEEGDRFVLVWREDGGPPIGQRGEEEGFGSLLARATIEGPLGGTLSREWLPGGLVIRLAAARDHLA